MKTSSYRESLLEDLTDPAEAQAYLNAALEDSGAAFLKALKNVSQAHGMAKVASQAGVERESLYRSLSSNGNPTWDTLLGVMESLQLKFTVVGERTPQKRSTRAQSGRRLKAQ